MPAYKDSKTGNWYVQFWYKDWTGKQKKKFARGFQTRREAVQFEADFKAKKSGCLDMKMKDFVNLYIVDVSFKYPKMFVVRPQFFLSLLLLLRSVATDKIGLRERIEKLEHEQFNASALEQDLCDFKNTLLKCHNLAASNKDKAIKRIDNAIKLLEETKDDLIKMDKHMDSAKKKADAMTIQKLAKDYPTMFSSADSTATSTHAEESSLRESTNPALSTVPATEENVKLKHSA